MSRRASKDEPIRYVVAYVESLMDSGTLWCDRRR